MNIAPDAWQADSEALRARAQQAEARIQDARDVCARALAVNFAGSTEADAAMAATASVILRALDGTDALDPQ